MSKKEIEAFKAAEVKRIEADRAKYFEDEDLKPFIKWPKGVTGFQLMPKVPVLHDSFGTDKYKFRVLVDGELYDWSVNPKSPMYMQLIEALGPEPVALKISRYGELLATRYELVE